MTSYLFIGGPADGERKEIPDDVFCWKLAEFPSNHYPGGQYHVEETVYEKKWFREVLRDGTSKDHAVFTCTSDVLSNLIEKYPNSIASGNVEVPAELLETLIRENPANPSYIGLLGKINRILREHQRKHGR